jgi:protein involved in polysaccharide export with SLBB domain
MNKSFFKSAVLGFLLLLPIGVLKASTVNMLPTRQAEPKRVAQYSVDQNGNPTPQTNVSNSRSHAAYRLRVGDKLRFELLNNKYKINSEVIIDNLGSINLEYINWIDVKGKTLQEATEEITELYAKDYFVAPNLKLRLVEKAPLRYKILGQVANPGFYEVPPGLEIDLLDAIAIAGGYTRIAGKITFKSQLPNGDESVRDYKIRELTKKLSASIPELKGDETIIVGESFF